MYGKCPEILTTDFLASILLFMQLFLKILSEMANSADRDQNAPSSLIWVCTVFLCHFVSKFGVQSLKAPYSSKIDIL